jgi:hypothetical protein
MNVVYALPEHFDLGRVIAAGCAARTVIEVRKAYARFVMISGSWFKDLETSGCDRPGSPAVSATKLRLWHSLLIGGGA